MSHCGAHSFIVYLLIRGSSRWLVYSRLRRSLPSCQSSQPVWESHLPLAIPRLWALLHPKKPPLFPLHQSVCPSDQLAQWVFSSCLFRHTSRIYTTSSMAINKKRKQMSLSTECLEFLWLLCEWSHKAVNGWASDEECMERIFTRSAIILISGGQEVLNHTKQHVHSYDFWQIYLKSRVAESAKPQCFCRVFQSVTPITRQPVCRCSRATITGPVYRCQHTPVWCPWPTIPPLVPTLGLCCDFLKLYINHKEYGIDRKNRSFTKQENNCEKLQVTRHWDIITGVRYTKLDSKLNMVRKEKTKACVVYQTLVERKNDIRWCISCCNDILCTSCPLFTLC